MNEIRIIPYRPDLARHFRALNIAWLEQYFCVEPVDEVLLGQPQKILDEGGHIYFALLGEKVAGTFALLAAGSHAFELGKMAVDASVRGAGIGNAMLRFCIAEARRLKAISLFLYSNTKLEPALHLYRKFGFREVPLVASEYKRSNIRMELDPSLLTKNASHEPAH